MHVAIAGHGGDYARRIHSPQTHSIGDKQVTEEVGCQVVDRSEGGTGGAPAVAGKAGHARPGVANPLSRGSEGAHDEGGVSDVEGSGRVEGHRQRGVQGGVRIAAEDRADGSVGIQFANHVVARIGETERSGAIERHACRVVDLGSGRAAAVAAPPGHAGAGDGGELPIGCQLANAVTFELGNVQISRGIHGDVARREQRGVEGCGSIGRRDLAAGAGNRGDDTVGSDAPHAMVAKVGHEEVPGGIQSQAVGEIELGVQGAFAIAAESGDTGAGDGGDHSAGHLAHAVVVGIGEVEIAEAIDGNALDGGELGRECRSAVADAGTTGHGLDMIERAPVIGCPRLGNAGGEQQGAPIVLHP